MAAGTTTRHAGMAARTLGVAVSVAGILGGAAQLREGQPIQGNRSRPLEVATNGLPGFTSARPQDTGITFTNTLPERRHLTNQILLNGAGVTAGDVDGDGRCDLYFARLDGPNALYRNLGNWRFEAVPAAGGAACPDLLSTGVAFADLDGDDDLDLIVNSVGGGTRLLFNDGAGRFGEISTPLNDARGGTSVALADYDGDGFLDLYLANYRTTALMDIPNARATFQTVNGRPALETLDGRPVTDPALTNRFLIDAAGRIQELGEPDRLYRNLGGTNFVAVAFTGGGFLDEDGRPLAAEPRDWGLTATFRDVNGDTLPDLYVCNDFETEDRFWINQGEGVFRLLPRLAQRKSCMSSMAVDFADINRDGHPDFLVLDMMSRDHRERMLFMRTLPLLSGIPGVIDERPQYELNTLFLNRGDTTFAEIAQLSGLEAAEWSWSCIFLDVDLDGWEDVLACNGMERAARDLDVVERLQALRARRRMSDAEIFSARRMFPRQDTANLAFRNRGDLTFEETGASWGFGLKGISSSMALADLDNDGDLDVVVNNLNGAPFLLRNNSPAPRIAVRLRGRAPNTRGIGARLRLSGDGVPPQSRELIGGGRYLAGDEALVSFAAGSGQPGLHLEVTWRSGAVSVVANVQPNHLYEISETEATTPATAATTNPSPTEPPLFEDVSDRIRHAHHDDPFDDFARQPLLPNKLSQSGPGATWFDLDQDGREDLVIPGGKGGRLAAWRNDGQGGFIPLGTAALEPRLTRDQTTALGWPRPTGTPALLVGSASYEDGLEAGSAVRLHEPATEQVGDRIPAWSASAGPLALADLDGDRDLDLFVGGRVIPGRYPEAADSRLFRNQTGRLEPDAANAAVLQSIGLVSGAVFSDVDGDGDADLVLACEWGPVRVLLNDRGRLADATRRLGLEACTGWWNSVTTGDFDGDGRLDIVAGNFGRNTKYERHRQQPLHVYYGDLNENGIVEVIESHYDPPLGAFVPERQLDALSVPLPFLRERFSTHRAFASAAIEKVLGEQLAAARTWEVNWLESTLFLNRGDHFEPRALPVEAQLAPVFGIAVGDADGDGAEDLFLAQNFFPTSAGTPRYDAGRGLWLLGDGRGGFRPLGAERSGIAIYGEQRGAAVADYDADGRLDLVVTQNGAATRLFHNRGARPGLRVSIEGHPENPHGVGATLRLRFKDHPGPVREIHAGSGYWSQDGSTQVFGVPEPPVAIEVHWPDGSRTETAVAHGVRSLAVGHPGAKADGGG